MIDWSKLQTAEQLAAEQLAAERQQRSAEAHTYLASTNWYVIRLLEIGTPIPKEISAKRAEAWAKVAE